MDDKSRSKFIRPYILYSYRPWIYINYRNCTKEQKTSESQLLEHALGEKFHITDYEKYKYPNSDIPTISRLTLLDEDCMCFIDICGNDNNCTTENTFAQKLYDFVHRKRLVTIDSTGQLQFPNIIDENFCNVTSHICVIYVNCTKDEIQTFEEHFNELKTQLGPNYLIVYPDKYAIRNIDELLDTIKRNSVYYMIVRGTADECFDSDNIS
ncbi:unnamed protein product [Didymodactylos carnosus]|uniref:Uncharacterized protein n=1 Tax=Didymodactylos carnosus TaxID=1234261 RepID=A0A8S2WKP5_9BILA|nr:unnamed protein product [Didymodactylos carnosus]CAF4442644.1 unnamed protein product [Didymodactylos carnosus]